MRKPKVIKGINRFEAERMVRACFPEDTKAFKSNLAAWVRVVEGRRKASFRNWTHMGFYEIARKHRYPNL